MDRTDYIWECNRQLSDSNYYVQLQNPIFQETLPLVEKIITGLYDKKRINNKQKNYLIGQREPRPRLFYILPKIHKSPDQWSKPHLIPPGRPIVSDCSSETYHTAEFIDFYLNPLSIRHKSYIKDTYDFIYKIKQLIIPINSYMFTMDIESLYTNIDIEEGIQSIKNIFLKYPDVKRPDPELIELLKINLTRNDFEFNCKFYLQVKGTAMGKKFAPAYANIFMAEWEEGALLATNKKPLHYYRYLDDIWGVWQYSKQDFKDFISTMNNHNSSIKVKATIQDYSINFLDTTTFKGPDFHITNKLDTKVYFKDTDSHSLLFRSSYHPRHTFAGLIKSQLIRFDRICSRQEDFWTATKVLFTALSTRGYSRSSLRKALKSFRVTRPRSTDSILPITVHFSTSASTFIHKLKNNFHEGTKNSNVLQNYRPIAAYKRNRNLKDILIKAKLPSPILTAATPHSDYYVHYSWIKSHANGQIFKTQQGSGLKTKNCVYLISCNICGKQYVGETGNTIQTRFYQHKYNIINQLDTHLAVNQHFILHGWSALRATVLQVNLRWTTAQRQRAEGQWIQRLDTLQPQGLNQKNKEITFP